MDALLGTASEGAAALVAGPADAALARLNVYRNTVRSNFTESLYSSFPAIRRLVGEDYFRQTARRFQRRHPSRSGDLQHVGEFFPDFLAELHAADDHRYLADVARLEWLVQGALLAAGHPPLDLARLATVDPAAYDALRFELHPSLRLFESRYPAQRIWDANVNSDAQPEVIDWTSGGERLAVMRSHLQLCFHPLTRNEFSFLRALQRGEGFAAAVDEAGCADPDSSGDSAGDGFDASAALARFVAAEAIVDFR